MTLDDKLDLNYLNYQVKHGVPLETALKNIGYVKEKADKSNKGEKK